MKELLANGANANEPEEGETAPTLATYYGHSKILGVSI